MAVRCRCGQILHGSQRRCKACAIEYLRQYETDYFESQAQDKPIVLDFSPEEVKRWQEMSPRSLPKVPRNVTPWSEDRYRRSQNVRLLFGIGLLALIFTMVLWALLNA